MVLLPQSLRTDGSIGMLHEALYGPLAHDFRDDSRAPRKNVPCVLDLPRTGNCNCKYGCDLLDLFKRVAAA